MILAGALMFSACSEAEKQQVIDAVQNINIRNGEEADTVAKLGATLSESSGLAYVNGMLWTHNDGGSANKLYQLDMKSGKILKTVEVSNASNVDWEDLAFDDTYLYIGDFGNNKGDRKDLKIYKIKLEDLSTKERVEAETIEFSYATQTSFSSANQKTNYDCEAFIVYENKIYLFTKNWLDSKTDMYVMGTDAGVEVAEHVEAYNTNALITGASIDKENKVLVLLGYTKGLSPRTWIFSEFTDSNFFAGKKEKLSWGTPAKAQVEGVTHVGKNKLYISSEKYNYSNSAGSFTINQSLYELDY